MKVVIFCHSIVSDWNHGNAHFLRGVATELIARGINVDIYEPQDSWSRRKMAEERADAGSGFEAAFPRIAGSRYRYDAIDLDPILASADLVLVHEWNDPDFIARLGKRARRFPNVRLLFHDTHHRAATAPREIAGLDLSGYDGVLAFGRVIRDIYLAEGWARRAWVWHEAADVNVFRPHPEIERERDLVWIGNWGDEERTRELQEFLFEPARVLELQGNIYGVRYPPEAKRLLAEAGFRYGGWLPNHEVPTAFARHRVTVHVPRTPYVKLLPGIPTIRVFEALSCGIPLVSSPWDDVEDLFEPGRDYLVANDGEEMQRIIKEVLHDPSLGAELTEHGRRTILERHTCGHRIDELLAIYGHIA